MKTLKSITVALAILAALICAIPAAATDLVLAPASLSFLAVQGTNPPPQTVNAYPSVVGTAIAPTLSSSVNWISLSDANAGSLATSTNIFVAINTQGLAAGFYNGQVTVAQAGFTKSPQVVIVALQVLAPGISYTASPAVLDVSALAGVNASSQFIAITTVGSASVKPVLTATTSTGGNWIALSAAVTSTFNTQSTVQVSFNTSSLATGFYTGVISAIGTGVQNSPVAIPVNLTIGSVSTGPSLAASPGSLSFQASSGANPQPMIFAINNSGLGTIFPTLTTATTDGNPWLNVALNNPAGVGGSITATVSINDASLANGNYTGSITIRDASAGNSPMVIPVALSVQVPNPVLALSASGLTFNATVGSTSKSSQNFSVNNAGTGALNYNAIATTVSGGNWLSVSPSTGAASASLAVIVDPSNLAAGVYRGGIVVSDIGSQKSQTVQILLGVGVVLPTVNVGGITNGASFASTNVAPGEIVSIFGLNLGPVAGLQAPATNGFLATSQSGISVTIGGTPAPLYYVGSGQINMEVPWEVAGQTSTAVVVTNSAQTSLSYTQALRPLDPAIFVAGNGRMAVLTQAGAQITVANPATAGQVLSLFVTGLGPVSPAILTGQLALVGTLYNTNNLASVTVGTTAAVVGFAGLAPGFVGLYQVNFTVPTGLAGGDQTLVVSIGNITSPALPLAVH